MIFNRPQRDLLLFRDFRVHQAALSEPNDTAFRQCQHRRPIPQRADARPRAADPRELEQQVDLLVDARADP